MSKKPIKVYALIKKNTLLLKNANHHLSHQLIVYVLQVESLNYFFPFILQQTLIWHLGAVGTSWYVGCGKNT